MAETKQGKVSDFEDKSSFLIKERALADDFVDESRGILGSANNLIEDICSQAKGFNSTFYNSVTSAFDETATNFSVATSNTADSLFADRRITDISRESAFEQQRQQYLK